MELRQLRQRVRGSDRILGIFMTTALSLAACSTPGGGQPSGTATVSAPVETASAPTSQGSSAVGEIGDPESTELTVGYELGDVGSSGPVWVAIAKGYYRDAGLEVELVRVDDVLAAMSGGSVDIAIANPDPAIVAKNNGIDLVMVCGWRPVQMLIVAVAKGIQKAEDLAGKDVVLGLGPGDPATIHRQAELAKVGWDLSGVNVNLVNPPGFANGWVELLINERIALTYMFPRHRQPVLDAGGTIILDKLDPVISDQVTVQRAWMDENPNSLARFLQATLRGIDFFYDPSDSEREEIKKAVSDGGIEITEQDQLHWEATWDTFATDCSIPRQNYENVITTAGLKDPGYDEITDFTAANRALKALGRPEVP